jgi:hypothetical protein
MTAEQGMKPAITMAAFAFLAATAACTQPGQRRIIPSNTIPPPYIVLPMPQERPQETEPDHHTVPLCAPYDSDCVLA